MKKILFVLTFLILCCVQAWAATWDQKNFVVTMWCPPPVTDVNISVLARDGYNLTSIELDNAPVADYLQRLDIIQKSHIKSMITAPSIVTPAAIDDPVRKAKLDELIDAVKKHPAFAGWFLADEPSAPTFPNWGKLAKYLKERDPEHFAYINLLPTYASQPMLGVFLSAPPSGPVGIPQNFAGIGDNKDTIMFYNEYLKEYVETVKPSLISYDHYHFLKNGVDGAQYFLNLELIRSASIKAKLPFLNIVQACDIEKAWRKLNANEYRWLAYTTMAYGGRGISWFLYWWPTDTGLYQYGKRTPDADIIAGLNHEINALAPQLLKLTSTAVYQSDPLPAGTQSIKDGCPMKADGGQYVIGMFKENGKQDAFMVVNRDYKNASSAKLTLNMGKGKLMEYSLSKRAWVMSQRVKPGSKVVVDLIPGGGKLFKISN